MDVQKIDAAKVCMECGNNPPVWKISLGGFTVQICQTCLDTIKAGIDKLKAIV